MRGKASFQEEIHAIEIDYGMTNVQRIHPQNATDSRGALPQSETRKCSHAEFRRRHFEIADLQIVDLRSTDSLCRSGRETRRYPRWFERDSERFKKGVGESCNKCAGIDEQSPGLAVSRAWHR